jgi:rubrerythrin
MDEMDLLVNDIAEVAGDADEAHEILGEHELRLQALEEILCEADIVRVHECPYCGKEFSDDDADEDYEE